MKYIVKAERAFEDAMPDYLVYLKEEAFKIKAHASKNEMGPISVIAHAIRGNAEGFGFFEVHRMVQNLETAAKASDIIRVNELAVEFEDYMNRVHVVFED